jgi:hypothetical protein
MVASAENKAQVPQLRFIRLRLGRRKLRRPRLRFWVGLGLLHRGRSSRTLGLTRRLACVKQCSSKKGMWSAFDSVVTDACGPQHLLSNWEMYKKQEKINSFWDFLSLKIFWGSWRASSAVG